MDSGKKEIYSLEKYIFKDGNFVKINCEHDSYSEYASSDHEDCILNRDDFYKNNEHIFTTYDELIRYTRIRKIVITDKNNHSGHIKLQGDLWRIFSDDSEVKLSDFFRRSEY